MSSYFVTRAGKGTSIERTKAYKYQSLAAGFMNRTLVAPLADKGVVIGHKTGTGDLNAKGQQIGCNDIGFVLYKSLFPL